MVSSMRSLLRHRVGGGDPSVDPAEPGVPRSASFLTKRGKHHHSEPAPGRIAPGGAEGSHGRLPFGILSSPKPHPTRLTTTHALVTSAPRQDIGGSGSEAGTVGSLRLSAPPPRNGGCRRRTEWRRQDRVGSRGSVAAVQPGDARSGRLPDVAMMQAPDFGKRHDPARLRPFDGPHAWRILVER